MIDKISLLENIQNATEESHRKARETILRHEADALDILAMLGLGELK